MQETNLNKNGSPETKREAHYFGEDIVHPGRKLLKG